MTDKPTVAFFRPDDERTEAATTLLSELGVEPLADPMLAVEPTGERPREDGDYTVLTSKTSVGLLPEAFVPGGQLCAIGETTATALRDAGYDVDIVPETYTSSGLVEHLEDDVDGARIEVARSDHGSPVLLDGLERAGAYLHETILYRLVRPSESGVSTEYAADTDLDGVLFSSSLTVEHFLEAATERGIRDEVLAGLETSVVGVIGAPTKETAEACDIDVDVVPADADFEQLARDVVDRIQSRKANQ